MATTPGLEHAAITTKSSIHTDLNKEILDDKAKLRKWLNMNFRIEMTDGRILIGVFLCTDRDANVILGETEEPRVLGLVMVPGRHIVSIQIDDTTPPQKYYYEE
ncbi:hypothetical protein K1T71_013206 [Dendrolimus kikuchii]|uniref:Uncharacterized protein n=1 Tax=Dendrolimus kikuchii TaxID=765133 RepID=A0ACC1CHT5_9NEOP|nr:hypothetical protein K1T71_013206 [Dendrolimus kikuchii]